MYSFTLPTIAKTTNPIVTYGLLAVVGVAICFVVYKLLRHRHRTRHAKKHGHSPHTGHHGNH